jgi:hypothetical protein
LTFIKTYDIRISRLYSRNKLGLQKIHAAMVIRSIAVEDAEKSLNLCKKLDQETKFMLKVMRKGGFYASLRDNGKRSNDGR